MSGRVGGIGRSAAIGVFVLLGLAGWLRAVPEPSVPAAMAPSSNTKALPVQTPLSRQEPVQWVCRQGSRGTISIDAMIVSRASGLASDDGHPGIDIGSGFFVDKLGHAVTNAHVVARDDDFEVTLPNGTRASARVVGRDADNDLAVIRVQVAPEMIDLLPLGDSRSLELGQTVVAFGDPFGFTRSVSVGIISATGRRIPAPNGRMMAGVFQVDAATGPGSSGGPILNLRGEVVGVVAATIKQGGGFGFAIPVERVRRVVPELIAAGRYAHPWLGASGASVSPTLARALGLPSGEGVLITRVAAGGPADLGGLRAAQGLRLTTIESIGQVVIPEGGDILIRVDGRPLTSPGDLAEYLESGKRPGDLVRLEVVRDGVVRTCAIELGERASDNAAERAERVDSSSDW